MYNKIFAFFRHFLPRLNFIPSCLSYPPRLNVKEDPFITGIIPWSMNEQHCFTIVDFFFFLKMTLNVVRVRVEDGIYVD